MTYTKSKIQQIREAQDHRDLYKMQLKSIMEKYNIVDNIFAFYNNQVIEITDGYFATSNSYKNLNEALDACEYNYIDNVIRIIDNKEFQVGQIKKTLMECADSANVFNIKSLS